MADDTLGSYDEPQTSGALVAVNYVGAGGHYDEQEVWVRSGANVGNWYPLGGEFGIAGRHKLPLHPTWETVLARGPVTLLVAGDQESYRNGWRNGRREMVHRMKAIEDEEAK